MVSTTHFQPGLSTVVVTFFEFLFGHDAVACGNTDLFAALATCDTGIADHSFFRTRFAWQANVFAIHDEFGFCHLFDIGDDTTDFFKFPTAAF